MEIVDAYFSLLIEQNWIDPRFVSVFFFHRGRVKLSALAACISAWKVQRLFGRARSIRIRCFTLRSRLSLVEKKYPKFHLPTSLIFFSLFFSPLQFCPIVNVSNSNHWQKTQGKGIGIGTSIDHGMNLIQRKGWQGARSMREHARQIGKHFAGTTSKNLIS